MGRVMAAASKPHVMEIIIATKDYDKGNNESGRKEIYT